MQLLRHAIICLVLLLALTVVAQDASFPNVIRFTGSTSLAQQQPAGVLGATFLIYKDEVGGSPLWMETQNIRPDSSGAFAVLLGSEHAGGIPREVFRSGEARWIATQIEGQPEQERVRLASVPYAMEAADASSLAGHPVSDFVLADQLRQLEIAWTAPRMGTLATSSYLAPIGSTTVVNAGTANALAKFTDASTLDASTSVFESGGKIGIGTNAPTAGVHISAALPRAFIQATTPGNNAGLWFESRPPNTALASKRGGVYFLAGNTAQNTFVGFTANDLTYHMIATQAGDVGVGTTAPAVRFHVVAPTARAFMQSSTPGAPSELRLGGFSSTSVAHNGGIFFQAGNTTATNFMALSGDDSNYHVVVTSAGDVGVGAATPSAKLEVAGDLRLSNGGVLRFNDGTTQSTAAGAGASGSITAADTSITVQVAAGSTTVGVANLGVTAAKLADGSVTTAKILDGAVTATKIPDASISAAKLQPGVLSSIPIADGSVTTLKIADNSVVANKIADGAISTLKIADSSVTVTKIVDASVTTAKIADNSVTGAKVADASVTTAKILDGAVTATKILDGSVSAAKLQPGLLTSIPIADGSVTTLKIADNSVATNKIADGAVTAMKILDGSVSASKLQPGLLTSIPIADGSVTTVKIADNSVIANKLADGAVTATKIPDASISAAKLQPGVLTSIPIADGSVTTLKIVDNAVTANKILNGAVTATKILDGAVTSTKIADGSVTSSKIAVGGIAPGNIAGTAATLGSNTFSGGQTISGALVTSNTAVSAAITANNTSGTDAAVLARNTSLSGPAYGTRSETQSAGGIATYGYASSPSGFTRGLQARADSTDGTAVEGIAYSGSGNTVGVHGITYSSTAKAVLAESTANTGTNYGVYAQAGGDTYSAALFATATNTSAAVTYGVYGKAASTLGIGVLGYSTATSGTTSGVYGRVDSASGAAGEFDNGAGGNVFVGRSRTLKVARIDGTGKLFVNGGTQTGGADFAESVRVRGSRTEYEAGDVLVIDPDNNRQILLSSAPYATTVAGIYSTKPGVLGTPHEMDSPEFAQEVPLAMIGIVPCKASAENGAIRRGDLLVTASQPGHVMRGTDRSRMLGAIVGKALQPLDAGTGIIECMVTLQ